MPCKGGRTLRPRAMFQGAGTRHRSSSKVGARDSRNRLLNGILRRRLQALVRSSRREHGIVTLPRSRGPKGLTHAGPNLSGHNSAFVEGGVRAVSLPGKGQGNVGCNDRRQRCKEGNLLSLGTRERNNVRASLARQVT